MDQSEALYLGIGLVVGIAGTLAIQYLIWFLTYRRLTKIIEQQQKEVRVAYDLFKESRLADTSGKEEFFFYARAERYNRWLTIIAALGGAIGIAAALAKWWSTLSMYRSSVEFGIISPAYAAGEFRASIAPIIPYVFAGVLSVMAIAFSQGYLH